MNGNNVFKWIKIMSLLVMAGFLFSCATDDDDDPVPGAEAAATVVLSAESTSSTTVDVTFDKDINAASIIDAASQFNVSNGLTVAGASVAGPVVTLTTNTQTGGASYTVTAHFTIQDTNGDPIDDASNAAVFSGFNALTYVVSAGAISPTSVEVLFSRDLNVGSIMIDGSQFPIDNGLTVSAATVTGNRVVLTTTAQTSGVSYTVTANSMTIQDINTNTIDPAVNTASFTGHLGANALVINEVDYQNFIIDDDEFVEILNTGAIPIDLSGIELSFVNGADGNTYRTIGLGSAGILNAGSYLVVGNIAPPGGSTKFIFIGSPTNAIQNGPDGIRLETSTIVLDSIAYEGPVISIPPTGEGSATTSDSSTANESICRLPNGSDTDQNSVDFRRCSITAGIPNQP